jgi:Tfp pilus assembly protein PilO
MELMGNYADVRDFIHEIESSPEFVVIDEINLAEGSQGDSMLRLTLQLSTYFRTGEQ